MTSYFENDAVIQKCEEYGIELVPKSLAGQIPINIVPKLAEEEKFDVVHIEDEFYIRKLWVLQAQKAGLRILSLANPDEIFAHLSSLGKNCLFYIDQNLGKGNIRGTKLAKKLFRLGFFFPLSLYGIYKKRYPPFRFLKGCRGKRTALVKQQYTYFESATCCTL